MTELKDEHLETISNNKEELKNRLINQFYLFRSPKNLSKSKKHVIFTSINILNDQYLNIKNYLQQLY